jgi:hypothetical protein
VKKSGLILPGRGAVCAPPTRQGCRLADELERAWGRLRVHAQVAQQPGYDGYLGVEAAMAGGGCERKFQHALTAEVEAWREKQLDAEILLFVLTTASEHSSRVLRSWRSRGQRSQRLRSGLAPRPRRGRPTPSWVDSVECIRR